MLPRTAIERLVGSPATWFASLQRGRTLASPRDIPRHLPEELRLGVGELDEAHEGLLRALARAIATARAHDGSGTRTALAALRDLFIEHFAVEDQLMEESRYPDRARHSAAHELFLQDLGRLWSEVEDGDLDATAHQLDLRVGEWARFHICVNDAPLAEHLRAQRGRARAAPARPTKAQPS